MVLTDAQATLEAARITAEATRCAGWMGFFGGFVALVGAVIVGYRQAKISEQQKDISALELKLSLYDKRYDIHDKIRNYFVLILSYVREPDNKARFDFDYGRHHSKLLFSAQINIKINEMANRSLEFFALKMKMNHIYITSGHYGDGNPEKESDFLIWLIEELKEIEALFIDEMRINSHSPKPPSLFRRAS